MRRRVRIANAPGSQHGVRIRALATQLNCVQTHFYFDHVTLEVLDAEPLASAAALMAGLKLFTEDSIIGMIDSRFDDNWFSHTDRQVAVVSTCDWEDLFSPPPIAAYLAFEWAQACASFICDLSETMAYNMVHEPPQGCLSDLCVDKDTIKYGMLSGSLCATCQATMKQYGASPEALDAIEAILAYVRGAATGRPSTIDPSAAFVMMRYSQNDENDNAWKYGIKAGLETSGMVPIRADASLESGVLLQKIWREIVRARLIVAKVDDKNLNVYFELGLSMGLGKETILVAEEGLILDLPSDLRSWECVTYPKGNYELLKDTIVRACSQRFQAPAV